MTQTSHQSAIEAIIFDWGGVLIDDPTELMVNFSASKLHVDNQKLYQATKKYISLLQTGMLDENAYWRAVCDDLGVEFSYDGSLWSDAFGVAFNPKDDVFSLIETLKNNGYKIGYISNTEVPSMSHFHSYKSDLFDAVVFSCLAGIVKPDKSIYLKCTDLLKIAPENSVFIDDLQMNVDGANDAGLHGILFESPRQIMSALTDMGINLSACGSPTKG